MLITSSTAAAAAAMSLALAMSLAVIEPVTGAPPGVAVGDTLTTEESVDTVATTIAPQPRNLTITRIVTLIIVIVGVVAAILGTQALAMAYVFAPIGVFLQCACCYTHCNCCCKHGAGGGGGGTARLHAADANSESSTAKISPSNGTSDVSCQGDGDSLPPSPAPLLQPPRPSGDADAKFAMSQPFKTVVVSV